MFGKILTTILLVGGGYLLAASKFAKKNKNDKDVENYIECSSCGTFVDIKETCLKNGKYICKECIKKDEICK